jgi:DNA-binding beta-propeller fold protein YncE
MASVADAALTVSGPPGDAVGMKFTDTMDIDQEAHRLYQGDNWAGGVDVFDITTKQAQYVKTIKIRGGLYGVCVAKNVGKVFAGLQASAVAVIDIDPTSPTVDTVVARVEIGGRGTADLIDYDPVHKKVYIASHTDGFFTSIDAVRNVVSMRLEGFGPELEQPRFNPGDGLVYLAGRDENAIHVIDPATDKLVGTYPLADPCRPNGMAIDPKRGKMLLVSSNPDKPHTVIWDIRTHNVVEVFNQTGRGDGAIYVPKIDRFLAAHSGFPGGPVVGVFAGGDPVRFVGNVATTRGASWVAYDETNALVYAPAYQDGRAALVSFTLPI